MRFTASGSNQHSFTNGQTLRARFALICNRFVINALSLDEFFALFFNLKESKPTRIKAPRALNNSIFHFAVLKIANRFFDAVHGAICIKL